ncbi:MAG: GDP-mannose 4,6-dehydratase [Candidatus Nanoarchaeia archaeon]|nr:GDP-mannose 4,6-dehydratase [Candidatus Nanoarchaeia archaeon]
MKGKNILITGINGFVGSILAQKLSHENKVYGLSRAADNKSDTPSNINLIQGDVTKLSDVKQAIGQSAPDVIFHLAAIADMPTAFKNPLQTLDTNFMGTANLLESVRLNKVDPKIIFAGSSEEYGLIVSSKKHYSGLVKKYGALVPEPVNIPELPVKETNPLRPRMSYGVAKLASEFLMRDYYYTYGIKTVTSRSFNHEGAGRPSQFVTSAVTRQVSDLASGKADKIRIGNVNTFRDWSHVNDTIGAYIHLAKHGINGGAYNVGSMRTNSVLSYILLSLEQAGYGVHSLKTIKGNKKIGNPAEMNKSKFFGVSFDKTKADSLMLSGKIYFENSDKGIILETGKGKVTIEFDSEMFRPLDVPIVMSDTTKLQDTGFKIKYKLADIIRDQLNYFSKQSDI